MSLANYCQPLDSIYKYIIIHNHNFVGKWIAVSVSIYPQKAAEELRANKADGLSNDSVRLPMFNW
jgi:hypothetical protein